MQKGKLYGGIFFFSLNTILVLFMFSLFLMVSVTMYGINILEIQQHITYNSKMPRTATGSPEFSPVCVPDILLYCSLRFVSYYFLY